MKPSGEPVAINVRTNVGRDAGSHEAGLAQITASTSILVMQKIRFVRMTENISSTSYQIIGQMIRPIVKERL